MNEKELHQITFVSNPFGIAEADHIRKPAFSEKKDLRLYLKSDNHSAAFSIEGTQSRAGIDADVRIRIFL